VKVQLERTFPMPAGPAATWEVLADVESVAACMPGAKITERIDERHYKGTVTVKLGPATLSFRGDVEVKQLDAANRSLSMAAKGTDGSGSSAASLELTALVRATEDGTSALTGSCEASVSGRAATFGGRMMDTVADQILRQFAANLAARVQARQPPPPASGPQVSAAQSPPTTGPASVAPPAAPLNALALLWVVAKGWVRGMFSRKAA
jgi:carbon monoxide dehydrogenase subunit G